METIVNVNVNYDNYYDLLWLIWHPRVYGCANLDMTALIIIYDN